MFIGHYSTWWVCVARLEGRLESDVLEWSVVVAVWEKFASLKPRLPPRTPRFILSRSLALSSTRSLRTNDDDDDDDDDRSSATPNTSANMTTNV